MVIQNIRWSFYYQRYMLNTQSDCIYGNNSKPFRLLIFVRYFESNMNSFSKIEKKAVRAFANSKGNCTKYSKVDSFSYMVSQAELLVVNIFSKSKMEQARRRSLKSSKHVCGSFLITWERIFHRKKVEETLARGNKA